MISRYDPHFFTLLNESYRAFIGEHLTPQRTDSEEAAQWLYDRAPFGILAHNAQLDPMFIYGNKAAQALFEYSWEELIALPSRLSAEAPDRNERQRFLDEVHRCGFVSNYRGLRIAKSGRRFWIENATVWQLVDTKGQLYGQAARLPHVTDLKAE